MFINDATIRTQVDASEARPCHELTPAEIEHFHARLCHARRALAQEIAALQRLATSDAHGVSGSPAASVGVPISSDSHMWERLTALRDIEDKRIILRQIDEALERLARKRYGLCVVDQAQIPKEVLEKLPWASRCLRCLSGR